MLYEFHEKHQFTKFKGVGWVIFHRWCYVLCAWESVGVSMHARRRTWLVDQVHVQRASALICGNTHSYTQECICIGVCIHCADIPAHAYVYSVSTQMCICVRRCVCVCVFVWVCVCVCVCLCDGLVAGDEGGDDVEPWTLYVYIYIYIYTYIHTYMHMYYWLTAQTIVWICCAEPRIQEARCPAPPKALCPPIIKIIRM